MPKSHDAKPRNRWRREKFQKEQEAKKKITHLSKRQMIRRVLREQAREMVKAQRELEQSLRKLGISWRKFEKAVHKTLEGKWNRIDQQFLNSLFEAHGIKEAA